MKKVIIIGCLIIGIGVTSFPALGYTQDNGENQTIKPMAAIKEWKYKYENGSYYKRLYNYSTGKWEGPWIKC